MKEAAGKSRGLFFCFTSPPRGEVGPKGRVGRGVFLKPAYNRECGFAMTAETRMGPVGCGFAPPAWRLHPEHRAGPEGDRDRDPRLGLVELKARQGLNPLHSI